MATRMTATWVLIGCWCATVLGQATGGEPSRIVTVTGRAVGSTPAAEEEAKLDALREAVRQVCGAFINAQTETADFEVVRDKVLEQPVGLARVVKVVRGPVVIDGDITEVQLTAEVFPVRFEHKWAEFAHIKQREGNPRCVVMIVQDDNVDDDKPAEANGSVQSAIEDFLLSQKVQLMDKQTTDAVRMRDLELAAKSGDAKKAAAAGAAFKADVVVMGKAEAKRGEPVNVGGHKVERWVATLAVRVIQTDSGAVILSRTYEPSKPYASTIGTGQAALARLTQEIAPQLLLDIGEAWRDRATAGRIIQVTFEPCTRKQFKAIAAEMIRHKGVTGGEDGFKLRELANEVANVEVDWKYGLEQLADRLEELNVTADGVPIKLDVIEQSANRITVRLRPAVTAPIVPVAPAGSAPAS
ncbi:MAG TPA: hypothetical protein PLQ89_06005 [Phycisphaerae bacterium]|nr:hypothetical protein [Phycisphaerae bacterium]HON65388.1 hypothetical protein [Phycisphaerae bacterium]HOQ85255.1 hypothetical protein [Phycisphaerae bacterium]HPP25594.1 hypothetical protein [Phycisphaerae bacterium]HPU26452.1 hypothetical protein [Phycisphaerae bacterium]